MLRLTMPNMTGLSLVSVSSCNLVENEYIVVSEKYHRNCKDNRICNDHDENCDDIRTGATRLLTIMHSSSMLIVLIVRFGGHH